ncbi:2,4-dichlorophenol 6-monooxygenase [Tateyamaria omphalii]|uniref:FAD-dependent oxidoreductase n=1 Tax=Tateyamaria omphalii TaxID=299262 RepID=UPI001671A677|nr:FAD-dependent monooxygenase [Tateyamaria omphalii]GGX68354.1 2,4-dichlorophenol 6-monooxygenase [Tateyamaria omphalii]
MADITTDVLIIGTGPAGSATAALLSTYGIDNMVVNRYRWLANTPRAHITNQRTMEVLRDLGREVEDEAYMHATEQDLMGSNVFCESLTGEELGRIQTWGTHPLSRAEHDLSSPSKMNDLPQTFMEPLLFKTACSRGTQARMSCEYQSHEADGEGVTTTLLDRLTNKTFTVRSKYLIGADGGNSQVTENTGLPIEGKMGVAGSINLLFKADLSQHVAHRPSVLYWVMQPGSNVGGIGMGVVRMVRPWNEWLAIWGYDIEGERPELNDDEAKKIIRDLVGDPGLEIEMQGISYWTVNDAYATQMSKGRVFIMGDAAHRHPPSNGLGSNTSIQDAFNLSWKLAAVLKGQAGEGLLDTYNTERAPVAKQIVTRANQSIGEFGPIFEALGLIDHTDPDVMQANMEKRCDSTPEAETQRAALREAIAFKKYEFDAHGVEMNQRYRSDAVVTDGQMEPAFDLDHELHYQPTTWPGARLPHVWLFDQHGTKHSTLDLTQGGFALITGLNGRAWADAAQDVAGQMGIKLTTHVIGPRQPLVDHTGDWARAREVGEAGCVLVRPDHHVAWRAEGMMDNPQAELERVLGAILAQNTHAKQEAMA